KQINILGDFYKKPEQLAVLQWLAGDVHYLAQKEQPAFVRANYQAMADHYRRAAAMGATPTVLMNERWGEAAMALGEGKLAIEKLEAAIVMDPTRLQSHVRQLVDAYIDIGETAKAIDILERMLKESKELSVDDESWGLCKRIEMAMKDGA